MKKLFFLLIPALTFFLVFASPANKWVEGVVVDTNGNPIAGVEVKSIPGTSHTATGAMGDFKIEVASLKDKLSFFKIGYLFKVVPIEGRKSLKVVLYSNTDIVHEKQKMEERYVAQAMGLQSVRKAGEYSYSPSPMRYDRAVENKGNSYSDSLLPPVNTEDYDGIVESPFVKSTNAPLSTFSIDVDAASYSNVRRFLNNGSMPPEGSVRIEEMINYFKYDYEGPKNDHPFAIHTEISDAPWNPEHKLVMIGLQGKKIPTKHLPASNLVFLIDVSGSMEMPQKLPLVKASLKLLIDQLRPQDKVSIVVYAGAAGAVLSPTSGVEKDKINQALQQLQAGGSTAGGQGLRLAYKLARESFIKEGNNRVILCSDGDFNVGESSDAAMEKLIEQERESGVFLTVLGFGMGNYKDNKMQKLAQKGNGNHAYIDGIMEAKKILVSEFGGTLFTIAKDVKLQVEFNPNLVQGYRLIGYENRRLTNEDFNDDKKDAGELGSGHTVTALYEIIPVGVKSSMLGEVDDLKYQQKPVVVNNNNDWMTIKFRYKKPDADNSILMEHVVDSKPKSLAQSSDNFRFAAAVAEWGMLLRGSKYKSLSSYDQVVKLARSAKGKDEDGYRGEFIRLVESAGALAFN